jgi:adenylate cyclase
MPPSNEGSREVEQTLRLARDTIERDIARYRIWAFATAAVASTGFHFAHLDRSWIPLELFLGVLVYALVLRVLADRKGENVWITLASLLLDLSVAPANFFLVDHYGSPGERATNLIFAGYLTAPSLLMALSLNSLRYSDVSAAVGIPAAIVLFFATVVPIAGFHPVQIAVGLVILLVGLLGVMATRQARRNLGTFARLQLLRRYLPLAAVERVMRDEPDAALALGGRLTTVTLLAADLRGFTAMSEKLAPSEVMSQLNAYHGVMIDVIECHGGAIDKFMGDGTLVIFGLNGSPEEGASAAVACTRAMLEALGPHNEARVAAGSEPLKMGIGVHTGPVIAGNIGVPGRRLEFTVIGDAVNTASRLEGQTKLSGVSALFSEATAALLQDRSALRELAPVSIRGKEQEIRIFTLASETEASGA